MTELLYRTKGSAGVAWTEISEGREVVLIVTGWRKRAVYRAMSSFFQYLELSKNGRAPFSLAIRIAWQSLFAPSIIGLCEHARSFGFTASAEGDDAIL